MTNEIIEKLNDYLNLQNLYFRIIKEYKQINIFIFTNTDNDFLGLKYSVLKEIINISKALELTISTLLDFNYLIELEYE